MAQDTARDLNTAQPAAERTHQATPMRLAFYLDNFDGGGMQVVVLLIADALSKRGHKVDLIVCEPDGPLLETHVSDLNIVQLSRSSSFATKMAAIRADPGGLRELVRPLVFSGNPSPTFGYFPALARYLKEARPSALFAATPLMNIEAALAHRLAGVPCRLVLTEHIHVTKDHPFNAGSIGKWLPPLCRRAYLHADAVVAVSKGLARDVSARTGIPRNEITTIYNPAVTPEIATKACESVDHPWFNAGNPPVILGAGRLGRAKDFETLIRAFAIVRKERPARLVVLGKNKDPQKTDKRRAKLMQLANELGVAEDVDFPGFAANPFGFMARASVFAVSSVYEGFCLVLAEAMACGCPVVSTDCPSGPAEILDSGRYGPLVPLGDYQALAVAILSLLDSPPDAGLLRARANLFSAERAFDRYEAILSGRPVEAPQSL